MGRVVRPLTWSGCSQGWWGSSPGMWGCKGASRGSSLRHALQNIRTGSHGAFPATCGSTTAHACGHALRNVPSKLEHHRTRPTHLYPAPPVAGENMMLSVTGENMMSLKGDMLIGLASWEGDMRMGVMPGDLPAPTGGAWVGYIAQPTLGTPVH